MYDPRSAGPRYTADTIGIKERGQPATSPIVEEINLGHIESGWSIRVRNRMGITCEDVLFAMYVDLLSSVVRANDRYDFFASPRNSSVPPESTILMSSLRR
jgi:hypothetical protein